MAAKKMNAFYAQSGGVTAVINASACGVIETARKHKDKIGKVYAGRNGIIGALTEDLIDTTKESATAIAALRHTPSGAFGSCRYKLKSLEANKREYDRLIEVFKAHNIGYFFYNGGGDSADTCLKVSQLGEATGYPLQAIHVPKTVDNDLPITDNCPGFGSVAKYIAVSTLEATFDVRSMAKTSTKVFVLEVMGRHAGWIAAAGAMASTKGTELPIVVLFPEVRLRPEEVSGQGRRPGQEVRLLHRGRFRRLPLSGRQVPRRAGHARRLRSCPTGRCSAGGRQHDQGRARPQVPLGCRRLPATRCAPHRVQDRRRSGLRHGQGGGRVCAQGPQLGDADRRSCFRQALQVEGRHGAAVQGGERREDDAEELHHHGWLRHYREVPEYLAPLMKGEDYPPYQDGLPKYVTLKNVAVPKKLSGEFKL